MKMYDILNTPENYAEAKRAFKATVRAIWNGFMMVLAVFAIILFVAH